MAHHQHHGAEHDAQVSRSLQTRPTSAHNTSMPSISEDDTLGEADEPPDTDSIFTKHVLPSNPRRQSLLTKALYTDSESHDEDHFPPGSLNKQPSISSTASTQSVHSVGDFTSDDGRVSPSTRASTPGSPRSVMNIPKIQLPRRQGSQVSSTDSHHDSDAVQSDEAGVEAKLGRKRCIIFSCGKTTTPAPKEEAKKEAEPAKRPCMIKFACPFQASKTSKLGAPPRTASRRLSPAPTTKGSSSMATALRRKHRDSDSTIRNESPATPKPTASPASPRRATMRRLSSDNDLRRAESCRFHEFASEEEEQEDWTQETTCHRSRLTVNDTLKKELDLRQLAEECDEEEALEKDIEDDIAEDDEDPFSDDPSDGGFQTDDEEGFAESDDDEDSDSDYEWWAPRKSISASPYVGHGVFEPLAGHNYSDSSVESSDGQMSPKSRGRHGKKRTRPVPIHTTTAAELPDSTDFVCGTLDEDRPREQAYLQACQERKLSKKKMLPQDIDPSFPISDPEEMSSDEEVFTQPTKAHREEKDFFSHGRLDLEDDDDEPRGRRMPDNTLRRSPHESPKRLRSPPPPKKSCAQHRSPAPRLLFGNTKSPRRLHSPAPEAQLTSPPPSRRGSTTSSPAPPTAFGVPFLSTRTNHLTHTASLPRSPHPFLRRGRSPPPTTRLSSATSSEHSDDENDDEEEDDGSATDKPTHSPLGSQRYARGAIDIAQGLERKRLKRREKFHKQYLRKEGRKEKEGQGKGKKRPEPGVGAERMRRVGLECAYYRGRRMLSI